MELPPRISRITHALIEGVLAIKKRNIISFKSSRIIVYLILYFSNSWLINIDSLNLIYIHITFGYIKDTLQTCL